MWVRVIKLVDAEFELTMTMKMEVVTLDEETPRKQFLYYYRLYSNFKFNINRVNMTCKMSV